MGGGGDRPGERLDVDVTEVLHREPHLVEPAVELAEADPRLDLDEARGAVGVDDAGEAVEDEHDPVGERRLVERVPGARDLHRAAAIPRPPHGGGDLLARRRMLDRGGPARLIASPVPPLRRHGAES